MYIGKQWPLGKDDHRLAMTAIALSASRCYSVQVVVVGIGGTEHVHCTRSYCQGGHKATRLHISEQWQLATGLMLKTLQHSDVLNPDGWMDASAGTGGGQWSDYPLSGGYSA